MEDEIEGEDNLDLFSEPPIKRPQPEQDVHPVTPPAQRHRNHRVPGAAGQPMRNGLQILFALGEF